MRTPGTRAFTLLAVTSSILALGVQPSATSLERSSQQLPVTWAQTDQDWIKDCDIDGSLKDLEDCPSEAIIAQYKEQGVDLVLRGGAYWETITGEYLNEQYGYKVVLPEGVEALCVPPPAPWHGFFIDLAHKLMPPGDASECHGVFSYYNWDVGLSVDGSYNAAEYASVDELVANHLEGYYEDAKDAVVVEEVHTKLRRMPAIHYVVHFSDPKSGEPMIADNVSAIGNGCVYEIGLTTTASRYPDDKIVLRQVVKGWRLLPMEK